MRPRMIRPAIMPITQPTMAPVDHELGDDEALFAEERLPVALGFLVEEAPAIEDEAAKAARQDVSLASSTVNTPL